MNNAKKNLGFDFNEYPEHHNVWIFMWDVLQFGRNFSNMLTPTVIELNDDQFVASISDLLVEMTLKFLAKIFDLNPLNTEWIVETKLVLIAFFFLPLIGFPSTSCLCWDRHRSTTKSSTLQNTFLIFTTYSKLSCIPD